MRPAREQLPVPVIAAVIHDAALLAAVFYAPIYWGAFGSAGQSFAACLVAVALVAAMVARFARGERLSLIPNAIHLPTLAFLGISALSALFSVSTHASSLELSRLTIGALLFALVANRAAMPAAPAKPVAALFACFALALPFVNVTGEADITLDLLTIAAAILVCGLMLRSFLNHSNAYDSRNSSQPSLTPVSQILLHHGCHHDARESVAQQSRPDPIRWWWQTMVIVAAFAVAATGLKEKVFARLLHPYNPTWRIFATFFNPNPLGGYLAMSLVLAVTALVVTLAIAGRRGWAFAKTPLLGLVGVALGLGFYAHVVIKVAMLLDQASRLERAGGGPLPTTLLLATMGTMMLSGLAAGLGNVAIARVTGWRPLMWQYAVWLLFLALLPTYSKGAALGLVVAVAIYLLLLATRSSKPKRNLMLVLGFYLLVAVLAFGALAASLALRERVSGMLGPRSASNMFRLLTWKGTLNMAADHLWLGIGPGAFKHAFPKYAIAGYVEAAHENYLQILSEQGVFGAAAFAWLIGAIMFTGWRAMARAPDFTTRAVAIGAICSLVVLLVHSLFDYDWYIGAINFYFWLLAGLLAHQAHGRQIESLGEEPAAPTRSSRRARTRRRQPAGGPRAPIRGSDLAAAAALALIAAGTVITSTRSALAERALEKGNTAVAAAQAAREAQDIEALRQHRSEALDHFRAAVAYDPHWPQALEQLGLLTGDAEGEELIKKAVALEPTDFQWRAALGRYYEVNGHLKEAIPYYQQALDRFPNSTRIMRRLAEVYQSLGDEHSALVLYRHMIELEHSPYQQYRALDIDVDTEYAYAHYYLGRAAERSGRLREAAREFQETLRVIGDYQYRGKKTDEMFAAVGRPKEPRAEPLQVLEAMARWRIANDYQQLGDPKTADIHRKLALSLLPEVSQVVAQEDEGEAR